MHHPDILFLHLPQQVHGRIDIHPLVEELVERLLDDRSPAVALHQAIQIDFARVDTFLQNAHPTSHLNYSPPYRTPVWDGHLQYRRQCYRRRLFQPFNHILRSHARDLEGYSVWVNQGPAHLSFTHRAHGLDEMSQGLVDLRAAAGVQYHRTIPVLDSDAPVVRKISCRIHMLCDGRDQSMSGIFR